MEPRRFAVPFLFLFAIISCGAQTPISSHSASHSGKAIGVPLPSSHFSSGSSHGIPLTTSAGSSASPTTFGNLRTQGPVGVALPGHVGGTNPQATQFSTHHGQSIGVPLSTAAGGVSPSGASPGFRSTVGVPLTTGPGQGSFGVPLSATSSIGGTTFGPGTIGRGIQETSFGTLKGKGASTFHINELPTSIELDKNLSPVPPYFVFPDSDGAEGSLTVGGPKTGGLVPITNPTEDSKMLRMLSQPLVRQRLVAEAQADKALKISSILMAHRQVRCLQSSFCQ